MSLNAPQVVAGISYDIFDSGSQTTASGDVRIKLYVPKTTPFIGGDLRNTYSLDVIKIGDIEAKFDLQKESGNYTDFKFNVPSFKFKARDVVTKTVSNIESSVDKLSEALILMPSDYVSTIEFSFRETTTFFYVKNQSFSVDVKNRHIDVEGYHPLAMNALPFGKGAFENQSYDPDDLLIFGGYLINTEGGGVDNYLHVDGSGNLITTQSVTFPNSFANVQNKAPRAFDFIKNTLEYYGDSSDNVTVISKMFPETFQATNTSVGELNCTVVMAGEGFAVGADEEIDNTNVLDYIDRNDYYIRVVGSTEAFASNGTSYERITNNELKPIFAQLARMDAAMFGSMLGETFYVFRGDKSPSNLVTLTSDNILSLKVKQNPINPSTFSFVYTVFRSVYPLGDTLGSTLSILEKSETINEGGENTVDINFAPATHDSIYNNDNNASLGKHIMTAKVAVENDGFDSSANVTVAPIYYNNSSNSYALQSTIESSYVDSVKDDIINAYKKALGFDFGTIVTVEVNDIDTLKPFNYINFESDVHPELSGRDFRISSISYNLEENKIKLEAYEF